MSILGLFRHIRVVETVSCSVWSPNNRDYQGQDVLRLDFERFLRSPYPTFLIFPFLRFAMSRMNFTNTEKSGAVMMTKNAIRLEARNKRESEIISRYKKRMEELRKRVPKSVRLNGVKNAKSMSFIEKVMFSETPSASDEEAEYQFNVWPQGLSDAMRIARKVESAADTITDLVSYFNSKIEELVTQFKNLTKGLFWQIPLLCIAYCVAEKLGIPLFAMGALCPLLMKYLGVFWEDHYATPAHQGAEDIMSLITTLALTCIMPKNASTSMVCETILRRVGNFSKAEEGFKSLFSMLIEASEKVINAIAGYFGAGEVQFLDTTAKVLRTWMMKVDAMLTICTYREPTISELRQAVDLQGEGIALMSVARTPPTIMALKGYMEKLGILVTVRRGALNAAGCFRQEPAFCLLGGASGVGKTVLQRYIAVAAMVLSGILGENEGIEQLWAKGASKYWNSYMGQLCLIWDDIFQVKKPATIEESEYMFIIKAVSNFMLPLEFADVESKGRFAFTSSLIVASTNEMDVKSAAASFVKCPEAVSRRISNGYWVKVKDEFKLKDRNSLDYTKWANAFAKAVDEKSPDVAAETVIPSAWEFYTHDFEGQPCLSTEPMDIGQVIRALADNLKDRAARHKADLSVSEKFCNAAKGIANVSAYDADKTKNDFALPTMSPASTFGGGIYTKIFGAPDVPVHQSGVQDDDGETYHDSNADFDDATDIIAEIEAHPDYEKVDFVCNRENVLLEKATGPFKDLTVEGIVKCMRKYVELDDNASAVTSTTRFAEKIRGVLFPAPSRVTMDEIPLSDTSSAKVTNWLETSLAYVNIKSEVDNVKLLERGFFSKVFDALMSFGNNLPEGLLKIRDEVLMNLGVTKPDASHEDNPTLTGIAITSAIVFLLSLALTLMLKLVCRLVVIIANCFYDCCTTLLDTFGISTKSVEQSHNPAKPPGKPRREFVREPVLQSNENHDMDAKKVLSNCFSMTAIEGNEWTHLGSLQFFDGDLAAMPYHFWRQMNDRVTNNTQLEFVNAEQNKYNFRMSMRTFLGFPHVTYKEAGLDLVFMKMDRRGIKAMKRITQLLFTEAQMAEFTRISQSVTLHAIQSSTQDDNVTRLTINRMTSGYVKFLPTFNVQGNDYVQTFQYGVSSSHGDCGSPLLLTDSRYHKGIYMGMHYAGSRSFMGSKGYATVITKEMVETAGKKLGCYSDNFIEDMKSEGVVVSECDPVEQSGLTGADQLVDGSITLLGVVDKPINSSCKTQLKLSPMGIDKIFGECPKAPAVLQPVIRDGKTVFPMIKSMEPYKTPHEWREVPNLELVGQILTDEFARVTRDFPRTILTPEEAAVGVPCMGIKAIPRDTSPGYPDRLEESVGKKAWLGSGPEYDVTGPMWQKLKAKVLAKKEQIIAGQRPAVLFAAINKDELRSHAKVEAVKTRYVSSCPQAYTILCKMYFGAYIGARLSTNVEVGFGPGMNPITDWGTMINYLQQAGKNTFAGDFKGFDASQQPYIHDVILESINEWYRCGDTCSEEEEAIRNMLWLDLIHSRHLVGKAHEAKYVVQWNKSLPSGHPLTTIVNSLFTVIVIGAAYADATGDFAGLAEHVKTVPFGDDNVNAVNDKMTALFDQVILASKLKDMFGLTYTDDVKDGELSSFKDIEKCTFLQRGIIKDPTAPGGWRAPLAEDSYLWTPYWYRSNKSCIEDMIDNIKTLQGEMAQHPQEVWDHRMSQLVPWMKEKGLITRLPFKSRAAALQWRMLHTDSWV